MPGGTEAEALQSGPTSSLLSSQASATARDLDAYRHDTVEGEVIERQYCEESVPEKFACKHAHLQGEKCKDPMHTCRFDK